MGRKADRVGNGVVLYSRVRIGFLCNFLTFFVLKRVGFLIKKQNKVLINNSYFVLITVAAHWAFGHRICVGSESESNRDCIRVRQIGSDPTPFGS